MNLKKIVFLSCSVLFTNLNAQNDSLYKIKNDACLDPVTYNRITTNNISANFYSGSEMHKNPNTVDLYYEFPKGSGKNAAGVSALWIGGIDGGGQLRIAAMTYRQNGIDFWNGPLNLTDASTKRDNCSFFDVAPSVKLADIEKFRQVYKSGLLNTMGYYINPNIYYWPANPIPYESMTDTLAPYVDVNKDGVYNPTVDGDYPEIMGDQMIYFIRNDAGGIHRESKSIPIGAEIHHTIYAYACPEVTNLYPELKNVIFHKYRIYNRSVNTVTGTVIGMWSSACIGDELDDFVGSNPNKGYAYYYNGDSYDNVYGSYLPATGIVLLKAPLADNNDLIDNNGNGQVDEPNEEMSQPNVFYYKETRQNDLFPNPSPNQSDPDIGTHYYGYLTGMWKDYTPFTCGGNAYNGTVSTKHVFPEEIVPGSACNYTWTEMSEGNTPGKRSVLVCTQPFTFKAKSFVDIDFAFVSAIDSTKPNDNWASVVKLKQEMAKVKSFYQLASKPVCIMKELDLIKTYPSVASIYPNPSTNSFVVKTNNKIITYEIINAIGQTIIGKSISATNELFIDLSTHPSGTYILKLTNESGSSIHKLMKTN